MVTAVESRSKRTFYRFGEKSNAKDLTHLVASVPSNLRLPLDGLIHLVSEISYPS